MTENLFCATGKRKTSIALIYLKEGSGKFTVNKKNYTDYFLRPTLRMIVNQPFDITKTNEKFDINANVKGGGSSGQADAIKHALAKALIKYNPDFRPILKKDGFLSRDSRIKERKKYGQKGARARFQFSKR